MIDEQELVDALESGVQPVVYANAYNSKARVVDSDQPDPDGAITFTIEVENHGVFSGVMALDLFDDREPEYATDPPPTETDWAWTQDAAVQALSDQVAEAEKPS